MKKQKRLIFIIFFIFIMLTFVISKNTLANDKMDSNEYTESYKKWLELPDNEKKNYIMPRKYEVPYTKIQNKNPLLRASMLGTSTDGKFNLKDLISNNLVIKNQQNTNSCWAFASLSSLETNMALKNYYNQSEEKIYDFSERHMEYATSRVFKNNEINSMGYSRTVGTGGSWAIASSYLTNGSGAINESQMPFENNENSINISQIQNKEITSQVYDTIEFSDYNSILVKENEAEEIKNEIKNHIYNNGSVMASIVAGSSVFNISKISNTTGALRVSTGAYGDHGVSIIGWDDSYNVSNWNEFEEQYRPKSNGAWIARNSWGTESGKEGMIYISYEDKTASQAMAGIVKAKNGTDYENIYQYDVYYPNTKEVCGKKMMLCNVFDKKTNGKEYITEISVHLSETSTCKAYINPNGTNKSKDGLKFVELKTGESITLKPGYHTLELANPVEITSDKFLVALEISSIDDSNIDISCVKKDSELYQTVEVVEGRCFKLDNYEYRSQDDWSNWKDLNDVGKISTIKAFTVSELYDESLKNIEIQTPPSKTEYFEGENFDKTGMVVKAYYNSKTKPFAILNDSDYAITNGTNLKEGQTSVKITYGDKSIEQPISVEKNTITELKIKTPPDKTEYKEGQNFDKTGMVIEASYKDGSKKIITDYTVEDGNNLKASQNEVTIFYEGKSVKQHINVIENPLIDIKITKEPTKTKYIVGQNFDKNGMIVTGTFQDQTTSEIFDYEIENGVNLQKGQTIVIIKYNGKTIEQSIEVEDKKITEIVINKKPNKLQYIQNKEELDLSGGLLKVNYNDGYNEIINLNSEEIKITGFNNEEIGKNTITVTYNDKKTTFDIQIVAEELPVNSNFDNIYCKVNSIKHYTNSENNKKDSTIINLTIDKLLRNAINDGYDYYYYLSSNKNEKNIVDWIKVEETQESNDKLTFEININDIKNYNDILNSNEAYIYIKELVLKGGNQSILISKPMKINIKDDTEIYSNDTKINNYDSSESIKDNTIASGKLPNTGIVAMISILIVLSIFGIIVYIKYKNLSKYVK